MRLCSRLSAQLPGSNICVYFAAFFEPHRHSWDEGVLFITIEESILDVSHSEGRNDREISLGSRLPFPRP